MPRKIRLANAESGESEIHHSLVTLSKKDVKRALDVKYQPGDNIVSVKIITGEAYGEPVFTTINIPNTLGSFREGDEIEIAIRRPKPSEIVIQSLKRRPVLEGEAPARPPVPQRRRARRASMDSGVTYRGYRAGMFVTRQVQRPDGACYVDVALVKVVEQRDEETILGDLVTFWNVLVMLADGEVIEFDPTREGSSAVECRPDQFTARGSRIKFSHAAAVGNTTMRGVLYGRIDTISPNDRKSWLVRNEGDDTLIEVPFVDLIEVTDRLRENFFNTHIPVAAVRETDVTALPPETAEVIARQSVGRATRRNRRGAVEIDPLEPGMPALAPIPRTHLPLPAPTLHPFHSNANMSPEAVRAEEQRVARLRMGRPELRRDRTFRQARPQMIVDVASNGDSIVQSAASRAVVAGLYRAARTEYDESLQKHVARGHWIPSKLFIAEDNASKARREVDRSGASVRMIEIGEANRLRVGELATQFWSRYLNSRAASNPNDRTFHMGGCLWRCMTQDEIQSYRNIPVFAQRADAFGNETPVFSTAFDPFEANL